MSTIGALIDKVVKLDVEISELTSKAESLKRDRDAIVGNIQDAMLAQDQTRAAGKLGAANTFIETVPRVTDWESVYKYISRTKGWELLHRRIGVQAWKERLDAGKSVPGIEAEHVRRTKISVLKK